jgi:FKBP-type peptidyl-prolyl cis-trans isomerase (trigger factor)
MDLQLPDLAAPSLEGLIVTPVTVPGLTTEQLLERLAAVSWASGERTLREPGALVEPGDQVTVTLAGRHNGGYVPFTARAGVVARAGVALPELPGLAEALCGRPVGSRFDLELLLPLTSAVRALRGLSVTFTVGLSQAEAVTVAKLDEGGGLAALGLGATYDAVLEAIAQQLTAERTEAAHQAMCRQVLEQLLSRAQFTLDERWVDLELRRRWWGAEGQPLAALGFSVSDLKASFEAWRSDVELRQDAGSRLKTAFVLRAIALEHRLELRLEDAVAFAQRLAPKDDVEHELAADPRAREALLGNLAHLQVLDFVMAKARAVDG